MRTGIGGPPGPGRSIGAPLAGRPFDAPFDGPFDGAGWAAVGGAADVRAGSAGGATAAGFGSAGGVTAAAVGATGVAAASVAPGARTSVDALVRGAS